MKVEKRESGIDRKILIGMIVSGPFLSFVSSKWNKEGMFASTWGNLIGGWCVKYYHKHGKAPGKSIEIMYEKWSQSSRDKDTNQIVERFLESLSGEYDRHRKTFDVEHLSDEAIEYFNKVLIRRLKDDLETMLDDGGSPEKAILRAQSFLPLDKTNSDGVDLLSDVTAMKKAFEDKKAPVIKYPSALGNFFDDHLEQDGFIAFEGPEKSGKTWWLLDIAWRALLQGRKVAFFEVGDLSQSQIIRRFATRAAKRPLKAVDIKYPTFLERSENSEMATVDTKVKSYKTALKWEESLKACEAIIGKRQDPVSPFKLFTYPAASISVTGIRSVLDKLDKNGWKPDVLVIDYADILAPMNGSVDSRDQINATWMGLRGLAQIYHCLVVTASQTDADSYNATTITRSNFSGDKRKNAHVTGMVGINHTSEEKEQGICRLNWVELREGEFSDRVCVHVAGCLGIANPALLSAF